MGDLSSGAAKPWYLNAVLAFWGEDVPRLLDIPQKRVARDLQTIEHRCTTEGESFLTKTLPALGKIFDQALQGLRPFSSPAFRHGRRGCLPLFIQGVTERIFAEDGMVYETPCTLAIRVVRQFLFWCKKIEKGLNDEFLRSALSDFIAVDRSLPGIDDILNVRQLGCARAVVECVLSDIGPPSHSLPKHGPGNVADASGTVGKRRLQTSYARLESVFRPIPWFRSLREAASDPSTVYGRPKKEFGLSRWAAVEKDSSECRVIDMHPAEYMWVQQALKDLLYDHIERKSAARGQVNFTDQGVNRRLTVDWRSWLTLDASKASDRNSFALAKALFGATRIWRWLEASRVPGTILPDGRILWYKKFAPMGSAVCFPVMALTFYAMAVAALHVDLGFPLKLAMRSVFVYGDDVIVPTGTFDAVRRVLESVGLKLNDTKSCRSGKFRESCGLDAFDGQDVTPIRLRRVYGMDALSSPKHIQAIVKHHEKLLHAGYLAAAAAFKRSARQTYKVLRAVPTFCNAPPSILAWFDPWSKKVPVTLERDPNGSLTGLSYVWGLVEKAAQKAAEPQYEERYLRESLARKGPVGRSATWCKGEIKRMFELPYRGRLVKDWVTSDPGCGSVGVDEQIISRFLNGEYRTLKVMQTHLQTNKQPVRAVARLPEQI